MDDWALRLRKVLDESPPARAELEGRAAAVLVPIVGGDDPALIFTLRTETLPSHSGQISFPGGSIDPGDPSAEVAALRETQEEIGIDPALVTVLGELETFPTFVSGYIVTPIVGWLPEMPGLAINEREVAEVLVVPISELTEEIRHQPGFRYGGRTFSTEAWIWRDRVIWGVTARILRLFLTRLAEAGLADAPGDTDSRTFRVP